MTDNTFVQKMFLKSSKVKNHCRAASAYQFITRLGLKQHDVILTKEQSLLTKIMSLFQEENSKFKLSVLC